MRSRFFNIWFTFYYSVTRWLPYAKVHQLKALNKQGTIIVSLTTKPSRVHKTWMVIESVLRQNVKPDAVILHLPTDEFPDETCLPASLLNLKKRGLTINFIKENLKPHNKYFYTMEAYPDASIVTLDDDKIYPYDLIQNLKEGHKKYPGSICAIMTRVISLKNNKISPYVCWDIVKENTEPSHRLLSLGVCGVLIPARSLHKDVFLKEVLKEKSLVADDLWIKIMALRNDTPVVSLAGFYHKSFISIRGLQAEQLTTINVSEGGNDKVFKSLLEHYNIDPLDFSRLPLEQAKKNEGS